MSGLGKTPSDLEIGAEFRNRGHFREMRVFFIFFLEINEINSRELAETPIFRWFSCGFIKNTDFTREICVFPLDAQIILLRSAKRSEIRT